MDDIERNIIKTVEEEFVFALATLKFESPETAAERLMEERVKELVAKLMPEGV
jgi:hypothetical protein